MVREFEDYLTQELSKTGYPLEIEISSMLDGRHAVWNNEYFFDWEENKAREIDISTIALGGGCSGLNIAPFSIVHRAVIECKKSETHAWIFLTRPKQVHATGQSIDFLSIGTKNLWHNFGSITTLCKHWKSFNRAATTYTEIRYQGKKSKQSEIFEAKNQLIKFIAYDISKFLKRLRNRNFDFITNHLAWIYHPIIVFEGKLYEAVVTNGLPQLFERKHLLLYSTYSPPYVAEFPNTEDPELRYLIDVVRKDFFAEFIEIMEKDYSALCKSVSENKGQLLEKIKKLLSY